jgi:uncharacterized membrane protein
MTKLPRRRMRSNESRPWGYAGDVGWILLFLVLVAAAFGVLGLVVKAAMFLVLTLVMTAIVLGYIAYAILKRQARKVAEELDRRLQPPTHPPTQDYRY